MKKEEAIQKLNDLERKLYSCRHLNSQVYLDSVTAAPPDTADGRGTALEFLNNLQYQIQVSEETGELLNELDGMKSELSPVQARQVFYLLREYNETKKIPQKEYVDYTLLLNNAESVWHKAKAASDFASFAPYLQKILDTNIRFAGYLRPDMDPYDGMLDQFERGMNMKFLDSFFNEIRKPIVNLVREISRCRQIDNEFLKRYYPAEQQRKLSQYLMKVETIDPNHCTIGETEHPFTLEFNKYDVRITTHYYEHDLLSSMYSVLHEGGHAIYELSTGDNLLYTSLAGGASMSLHESQSRFFENYIGRSEAFLQAIFPAILEIFPEQLAGITPHQFYRAANRVEPSLIRTEADELTYCLHVMLRYEIEKMMVHKEIKINEVPHVWNQKIKEYFDLKVPDDKHGCLQDSHWAGGSLGYFPSYALGNAYGVQIAARMSKEVDIRKCTSEANLMPVRSWLTDHLYQYGLMYEPRETFEKAAGEPFSARYYIEYLTNKYTRLYSE